MKSKILIVFVLVLLAGFCRAWPGPLDLQLADADNAFAFKLLQQLERERPVADIFISPYGAATALRIVASGAAGQTKIEMEQVLGTSGLSAEAMRSASKKISESFNNRNTNVILTVANGIWYRQDAPVRPEFIAGNQRFFDCTFGAFNPGDPHPGSAINAWASRETHGKIMRVVDDGLFEMATPRLFLVNAVYFKGKWSAPFKVEDTIDRPFYLRGGGKKIIAMMRQSRTFTYRRGTRYQAVRLPYEGQNMAMYVFLPDANSSPEKLLGALSGDTWQRITKPGFSEKAGTLVLPKFKLASGVELVQPLQAMGMKTVFGESSDFSGIGRGIGIHGLLQKSFVEVKEEGTEAAAATVVAMTDSLTAPRSSNPFQMLVNRPFLFLIEDNRTGIILFIGVVFDPSAEGQAF